MDEFSILIWPITVLITVLLFFLLFRSPISALIARIRHIGPGGASIGRSDDVEKQRVEHKSRTADELLSSLNSVVLQAQEKAITDDLAARKIEDAEDRERVLVRFLASNQLAYVFEVINAKIFGSQLALLQRANAEEQGIEREDVEPFYQSSIGGHFDDDPEAGIRSYIHFLLEHRLLVQELEKYKITYLGRDFLTYIIHHGHSGAGFM